MERKRSEWIRKFRETEELVGGAEIVFLLNHHYAGELPGRFDNDSLEWFPGAEYRRVEGENYLVPPSVTKAKLRPGDSELDTLNYWRDQFGRGWTITEAEWGLFSWTPRILYRPASDEQGSYLERFEVPFTKHPKPSWDDLKRWEEDIQIAYAIRDNPYGVIDRQVGESRDALLAAPVNHPDLGDNVHTGAGLAHMPAMAYMSNRSASAGVVQPHAVMRREGDDSKHDAGEPIEVWTTGETHALLEEVANRTNHLESARNVIRGRLYEMRKPIFLDDAGLGAGATEDQIRARKAKALNDSYDAVKPAALDKAMAEEAARIASADTLPAEFERARIVLIERLEARAMAQIKGFKRALSQQGVDVPEACDDEANATRKVALACRQGVTQLYAADTAAEAKTTFDAAAAAIEAVTALNVPVWSSAQNGHVVTVEAANPSGTAAEGAVAIYPDWTLADANDEDPGATVVRSPANKATLTFDAGTAYPVAVAFRARNDCGDSGLAATIEAPQGA